MTKDYVLLGHPLGHSLSPWIHRHLFESQQCDATYALLDLTQDALGICAKSLCDYAGYNVTIPYKLEIMQYLDRLDASAEHCGAVNCVAVRDGKQIGYNTDRDGFVQSLPEERLGMRVLLIGCGGVGRMMATEAAAHGATLTIAVRRASMAKIRPFCRALSAGYPTAAITLVAVEEINGDFDLLLNATPIGMFPHPEECPVSEDVIARCGLVFDAIYNPVETQLLKIAAAHGIATVDGMEMLVRQAACAHTIWYGAQFSDALLHDLTDKARKELGSGATAR